MEKGGAMPAALPLETRQAIVNRRHQGETFRQIADELGVGYDTVRNIWHRWQQTGNLQPNYQACAHLGPRCPAEIYEAALTLKRDHPRWGAGVIRVMLSETYAGVPSVRTLQRWFRQAGLGRTPRLQQTRSTVQRGQEVHAVWAIDAKEQIQLADGSWACWLTITDEASGAILQATAFPPPLLDQARSPTGTSGLATGHDPMGLSQDDAL
jgi:transposase